MKIFIILMACIFSGCATVSDIERLESKIDSLKEFVIQEDNGIEDRVKYKIGVDVYTYDHEESLRERLERLEARDI